MITAVGSAIDYSRASISKTGLQAALDAAVLAGATDQTSNWQSVALIVFNANAASKNLNTPAPTFQFDSLKYSGTATDSVPTRFMGLVHIDSIPITARSAAMAGTVAPGACVVALGSDVGITLNGAPNVNLSGCALRSNTSVNCNGHSGNAVATIAVGTATGCSNPKPNAKAIPDIYASLASNITAQCGGVTPGATWTPGSLPPVASMRTVSKGSYTEYHICGDLTLSGSGYLLGNAPSSDAVIIIENGNLTVANNATINTVRTTIVLTGDNSRASSVNFPNGNGHAATLSLSPSTAPDNPWQGVSLYQNPSLTNSVDDTWGPGATFNADGVVYLPKANVTTRGNAGSSNSACTVFVTNSFTTNGSINLNFSQVAGACSALGVKQYTGTGAYLIQ